MGFLSERDVSMRCRAMPYVPLRSAQLWAVGVGVQAPVRRDGPTPDPDCPPRIAGRERCIARRALLTIPILTVGVEFSPLITWSNVDLREVADTQDLNVVRGLYEVCASDGTIGDEPCPVARLDAPCDLDTLRVPDDGVRAGFRRSKDAPVFYRVHCRRMKVSVTVPQGKGKKRMIENV